MEIEEILTKVRRLEGSIIETTTNQWGHENGDPDYFSHYRYTYQIRKFLGFDESRDQYRFLAYSYSGEGETYDYYLDDHTVKKLLRRGCEVRRSGGETEEEEYDPEVVVETTRIIDDTPIKVLKNSYLVREWWRTVKEDEGNVVKKKDLYVDLLKVDNVTYDPEDAIYIIEVTSQCSGKSRKLHYLSEEVRNIIYGERTCTITARDKIDNWTAPFTLYENTYLLPERIPEELTDKGIEWLLSEEGVKWLKKSHVKVHTLNLKGEGPTPQPVPRDTDITYDKRRYVPALSFESHD